MLSIRAINQYRRRDILAYLGLRYYLANSAAKSDEWANQIAPTLVLRRAGPAYLAVQHFKDVHVVGHVIHREIFLPGPNEVLAEAALLNVCSSASKGFTPASCVYSYRLAKDGDVSGVYQHYMYGLRERHRSIAHACRSSPNSKVVLLDIRRFYPSISISRAHSAWGQACKESSLSTPWADLGAKLLHDQGAFTLGGSPHLLTGPMFSHLIGNLVLKNIDERMVVGPARYFRYVDDITLVGSDSEIDGSRRKLNALLGEIGLDLHDQDSSKSMTVSTKEWLCGKDDFEGENIQVSWMAFIGNLKRLLLIQPGCRESLISALSSEGFRVPVPDYSGAVEERTYRERMARLFQLKWFQRRAVASTIQSVITQAQALRDIYSRELRCLLEEMPRSDVFTTKRLLPKIRYRFGRLAYLGNLSELEEFSSAADGIQQLRFQSVVASSIATGDLSKVLSYGVNAAQAVAQPLRMQSKQCFINGNVDVSAAKQSLAVLAMNGLNVEVKEPIGVKHELLDFAKNGATPELMRSSNPFIQEIACLHGGNGIPRHQKVLDSAFDRGEDIGLDAIEQDHQSS